MSCFSVVKTESHHDLLKDPEAVKCTFISKAMLIRHYSISYILVSNDVPEELFIRRQSSSKVPNYYNYCYAIASTLPLRLEWHSNAFWSQPIPVDSGHFTQNYVYELVYVK